MGKNKLFLRLMIKNKNNLYSIVITFFILIMFGFIFFELSSNAALKNADSLDYTLFTPISLFINVLDIIALLVIMLCSLILIEIYKGFIGKNLTENSIFRTCGYSSVRLSILYSFIFIVICIFIIPFALLGGYILTFILHFFLFRYLQIDSSIYTIDNSIFIGIFLLIMILIVWITLYTIGYFHRKELLQLLNEARGTITESITLIQVSIKVYVFFFVIGWLILIGSLLFKSSPFLGIFFICITLKKINFYILGIVQKFISEKNCVNIVSMNEAKEFLQRNSTFVYLYQMSIMIVSYILIYMCILKSDQLICLIACSVCLVFLSSCLVYKYFLETNKSKRVYDYCYLLGYSSRQILGVKKQTFNYIINFIFLIPTLFQVILFFLQIILYNYPMIPIIYVLLSEIIVYVMVKLIIYKYQSKLYKLSLH